MNERQAAVDDIFARATRAREQAEKVMRACLVTRKRVETVRILHYGRHFDNTHLPVIEKQRDHCRFCGNPLPCADHADLDDLDELL